MKNLFYFLFAFLIIIASCSDSDNPLIPNGNPPANGTVLFSLDSLVLSNPQTFNWFTTDTNYFNNDTTWQKVNIKFLFQAQIDPRYADESFLWYSGLGGNSGPSYIGFRDFDSTFIADSFSSHPTLSCTFGIGLKSQYLNTQSKVYLKNVKIIKLN